MDNKFLHLVSLFLKAGASVKGVVQPTEKGVPQGGVLSPLLANVVLNRLDWFLHEKGAHANRIRQTRDHGKPNIRFVRYADDWCVFITRANKQYASTLRDQIRDFLKDTAGLTLSEEKTHITHVTDGFNFLGFRLMKGVGRSGKLVPKIKIGDKAKKNIRLRLQESLRFRPAQESIALRVERTSRQIRGWREYFRLAHDFPVIAAKLDYHAFWATVKAICRKQDISTAQCLNKHCRKTRLVFGGGLVLGRFRDAEIKLRHQGPKEYVPGGEIHFEEYDDESVFSFREDKRLGAADMRWEVMVRDSLRCRKCGTLVDYSTAHIDHIIPVKRFASFRQAHRLDNLQTLCKSCHQEKTNEERRSQR